MAILTTSFNGDACPEEIAAQITLGVLTGNPFTRSLRLINTEHVAYTTLLAGPTGMDWVAEGAPLPTIALGDDSYTVVPCKLAGVFDVSAESFDDSAIDLGSAFVEALTEATASVLDGGLLGGSGVAPEPHGAITVATAVTAASLRAGVGAATAAIGEEGGTANTVALSPTDYTDEAYREASGVPVYPNGLTFSGIANIVQVPGSNLTAPLVYDSQRMLFIQRGALQVSTDASVGFKSDTIAVKIKGRFGLGIPVAAKSIRKITVTP